MAKESTGSELLGGVVVIIGAGIGAVGMGLALSRTRLSPGAKGAITGGVNVAAALTSYAFGMPHLGHGFLAAGVLQGGWYGAKQVAAIRYLGSPESKTALPAPAATNTAAIAAAAGAAAGAAVNAATGTGT